MGTEDKGGSNLTEDRERFRAADQASMRMLRDDPLTIEAVKQSALTPPRNTDVGERDDLDRTGEAVAVDTGGGPRARIDRFYSGLGSPVNPLTRQGLRSIGNVVRENPVIDYNPDNPSSLLRNIVNYPVNVGTTAFKALPGAVMTGVGALSDMFLPFTSEKTRQNVGETGMEILESSIGYGVGPRVVLNYPNLYRPNVKPSGTSSGGLGSLFAPQVKTLTDAQKESRRILDLGPRVMPRDVQVMKGIKREELDTSAFGPDYVYDFRHRDLPQELKIRQQIARDLNLDMSRAGVRERARNILGSDPKTVYAGRTGADPRLVGKWGQYTSTNPRVARTYSDGKKPNEYLFMRDPYKRGVVVDARGETWNRIPSDASVRYRGGFPERLEDYTGTDWTQSTDEVVRAMNRPYDVIPGTSIRRSEKGGKRIDTMFDPDSVVIENIIDPKALAPRTTTADFIGDNYITLDRSTLKSPDALMLPQFKRFPMFDYRGGGIVSALR